MDFWKAESCDGNCPTEASCLAAWAESNPDQAFCAVAFVVGSSDSCTAECAYNPVTESLGEMVVVPMCVGIDSDCDSLCGNGVVVPAKLATAIVGELLHRRGLHRLYFTGGEGCQRYCEPVEIVACAPDDGCCPAGCESGTDSDCSSSCGNGVVDSGETCDGDCPTVCSDADFLYRRYSCGIGETCSAECGCIGHYGVFA